MKTMTRHPRQHPPTAAGKTSLKIASTATACRLADDANAKNMVLRHDGASNKH